MFNTLFPAAIILGWVVMIALLVGARVAVIVRQAREERRWNAYGRKGDETA